jgi:hypothetical protein
MPEKHLYEYAVIRLVPVVEREEFLNVGIILFCKREKFIRVLYNLDEKKLQALRGEPDFEEIKKNLEAFQKIANGEKNCSPIADMDPASRFRWLTAVRSSSLQTSRPHPGLTGDL